MTNFCTLEVLLVKQKCLRKIAIKLNTAVENNFLTKIVKYYKGDYILCRRHPMPLNLKHNYLIKKSTDF